MAAAVLSLSLMCKDTGTGGREGTLAESTGGVQGSED